MSGEPWWTEDFKSGATVSSNVLIENVKLPQLSKEWTCHMFGSTGEGLTYVPREGYVPNWFVRWMMRVCFDCRWERRKATVLR